MIRRPLFVLAVCLALPNIPGYAQLPDASQMRQERAAAEKEVPQLVESLNLKSTMTVADIGAGFGATTIVLARTLREGQVFATDIGQRQLQAIRDYATKEELKNVTVIEGSAVATNLPLECCDAMVMRDAYHHVTDVEPFTKSLFASLKRGGQVALIDFVPEAGSKVPAGVPLNGGGHGVTPAIVVAEMKAAGFTHLRTVEHWPESQFFVVLLRK